MWYQLESKNREGSLVEYSTDFNFFVKNQIMVVSKNNKYCFQSRIESKVFHIETATMHQNELSDDNISKICEGIHKEILEGKHGLGKLVN